MVFQDLSASYQTKAARLLDFFSAPDPIVLQTDASCSHHEPAGAHAVTYRITQSAQLRYLLENQMTEQSCGSPACEPTKLEGEFRYAQEKRSFLPERVASRLFNYQYFV
jgi:hypothetical protein